MGSPFDAVDPARLRARRSEKWRAFPPDVLPAFVAEMDFPLADPVRGALRAAVDRDDCGYAHPAGLAEAFAAFAADRWAWPVDPDRVLLVADVMAAVDAVLGVVTEPGDGVVVNPPVYPPFFEHIARLGRRVVEVPLSEDAGGWRLDLAALEAAFGAGARAYLMCHPHNPTGRVADVAELRAIATLAERYDVAVLSDEVHAPLTLPGSRHVPYASLGEDACRRGVTLTSGSKAFNLAGLKCAVIVAGSRPMRRELSRVPDSLRFAAGLLGVVATEAAWRDGGDWLDHLLGYLDGNRALLGRLVAEHLPGAVYRPPAAGYLAWVDCRALGLGDDPRDRFLERGRVALGRGLDFGREGAGFVRITMGTSAAMLTQIVERMAAAL